MGKNKKSKKHKDQKEEMDPNVDQQDTATMEEESGANSDASKELDELREKYIRLVAEFDNFRKERSRKKWI